MAADIFGMLNMHVMTQLCQSLKLLAFRLHVPKFRSTILNWWRIGSMELVDPLEMTGTQIGAEESSKGYVLQRSTLKFVHPEQLH